MDLWAQLIFFDKMEELDEDSDDEVDDCDGSFDEDDVDNMCCLRFEWKISCDWTMQPFENLSKLSKFND